MELYTLNDSLQRVEVFDRFESLIWTERLTSAGDFEMVTHADNKARQLLQPGIMVTVNNSFRVATIEEVEDKEDSEGRSLLSLKGPHLESIFNERTTRGAGGTTGGDTSKWTKTAITADQLMAQIVDSICIVNNPIPADRIPFYTAGNLYPVDTIGFPSEPIATFDIPTDTVYNVISGIADSYGIGFRLYRGLQGNALYFNVYMGSDRTTKQSYYPPVVFSPDLDNLGEVSHLKSISGTKNVAYVYHDKTSLITYLDTTDPTKVTGLNRRALVVDARELTDAVGNAYTTASTALTDAMTRLGKAELLKYRPLQAIDGQVPQNSQFRYGIDYNLGDLIEMRTNDGTTSVMRVTEHIFSSDEQGDRSYPTIAVNEFIVPGSWDAFNATTSWDSVGATLTWNNT